MPKEAIISSSRLNSYGCRVLTSGVDLEQYSKNPVLLYMHRRGGREDMPIGTIENLRVDGDYIYGTPKFDDDTEQESIISAKWERGTLRMLSAGIEMIEFSDDPQHLTQGQTRPTVIKSKLLEVSIVDIGANDDALQTVRLYQGGNLITMSALEQNDFLPLLNTPTPMGDNVDNEKQTSNNFSMDKILMTLGLGASSTEDQAVDAIKKLQQDISSLNLARVTDAVDAAISEKRITANQKEHFMTLGQSAGVESLRQTLSMFSPSLKPMDLIHQTDSSLSLKKWADCSHSELETLRCDNQESYVRLYREHYGFEPNLD